MSSKDIVDYKDGNAAASLPSSSSSSPSTKVEKSSKKKSKKSKRRRHHRRDDDDAGRPSKRSEDDDANDKKKRSRGGKLSQSGVKIFVAVALVVLVAWWKKSHGGDAKGAKDGTSIGKALKDDGSVKKVVGGVEVIASAGSDGEWNIYNKDVVAKRPSKQCAINKITPQVFDPLVYTSSKQKGWERRAWSAFPPLRARKGDGVPLGRAIVSDFEDRRWKDMRKKTGSIDATFVILDEPTLYALEREKPELYFKLYHLREGTTYLSAIRGAGSLSGDFQEQYFSRRAFADHYGCSYTSLRITHPIYDVSSYDECMRLSAEIETNHQMVLVERSADRSNKVHTSLSSVPFDLEKCSKLAPPGTLLQEGIKNPLLVQKRSFDVRSYMLVASTMPHMVFFRRGFARRSRGKYQSWTNPSENLPGRFDGDGSSVKNFISLKKFGEYLATNKLAGAHFVDTFLQSAMKKIALFTFHAARRDMERRRGSYMLFSLDFTIDEQFHVHLENTAAHPDLFPNPSADHASLTSEMHDLLQELHEEPTGFSYMTKGDKYGKWELIFSEVEETCSGIVYNPCSSFYDFNSLDTVKHNRKISLVHNTARRMQHEVDRVKKKREEHKKETCRAKKLHYPGPMCDRLLKSEREAKFKKYFEAHEKSYNPNQFRRALPGEVFPWEEV